MTVRNTKTGCLCRPLKRSPPDVVYTPFDVTSLQHDSPLDVGTTSHGFDHEQDFPRHGSQHPA